MTLTKDRDHLDLLQGTLDLLVLQILRRGSQHGYGISKAIRAGSNDLLQVETGSLYPALHRLEKKGLVASKLHENQPREIGPPRRRYTITELGERVMSLAGQLADLVG